jgi:hypothetical protein
MTSTLTLDLADEAATHRLAATLAPLGAGKGGPSL